MEHVDACVIGAGVIGLALACGLARAGRDVVALEAGPAIGQETSSRNSGVIHAGIYYPVGSLKARLCVRGRKLLYEFCRAHHVDHRQCGKLIVATEVGQIETLKACRTRALENGVVDIEWLGTSAVGRMEPEISAHAALHSPSTGIVDSHGLCQALAAALEQAGGTIVLQSPVTDLWWNDTGIHIATADLEVRTALAINAAGLKAAELAHWSGLHDVPQYFAKGHYYRLSGPSPFNHLVYPVADSHGLGIHVTLDMAGRTRFGPDARWVDRPDYTFEDDRRQAFVEAIRRYYPALDADALAPDTTGIRPRLVPPGHPPADFLPRVQQCGNARLVHMLGMESPGLTAALALSEYVIEQLGMSADGRFADWSP